MLDHSAVAVIFDINLITKLQNTAYFLPQTDTRAFGWYDLQGSEKQ